MNNKELWKPVVGYEGLYEVSNMGRVRSVYRCMEQESKLGKKLVHPYGGKLMKPSIYKNKGYVMVSLSKRGKIYHTCIHRLVASAFIPNPDNLPQVNHKDENKHNNHVDNLEWCSPKYNISYGTRAERFAQKKYRKVVMLDESNHVVKIFEGIVEAENQCHIPHSNIIAVCRGRKKRAGGYKWAYLDDYNE